MLKDKVAVVTGAGRGIGREIAKTFAGYGAKVVVNFNGSEERANSLVEEIKAAGGEAVAFKANVADFAEAEALMKFAVAIYGRIDILVNNAGITRDNIVLGMKEADFDDVIKYQPQGYIQLYQACVQNHDEAEVWTYHQHVISSRNRGKCRTGELRSIQGWCYRYHQVYSQGARKPWNHSERHRSWIHQDRHDRCTLRQGKGGYA